MQKEISKNKEDSKVDKRDILMIVIFVLSIAAVFYRYLFPIPILSLILGIIYSKKGLNYKKNIIVGIIALILIFIQVLFPPLDYDPYDYSRVMEISKEISVNFPDDGECAITLFDREKYNSEAYIYMMGSIYVKESFNEFLNEIESNKNWIKKLDNKLSTLVPFGAPKKDDYFLIYNVTLNEYNTVPENEKDGFIFYYLSYNIDKKEIYIAKLEISPQVKK